MTPKHASSSGSFRVARAIAASALVVLAAAGARLAAQAPAATPAAGAPAGAKRNIAGPGDYPLREKIVHLLSRDPDLSREPLTIILVNGGVVLSGEVKNCALERRALFIAAQTRGVINVTDEITVPRGNVADAELAKAATSLLSDAAGSLGLKDLDVQISDGVLTLKGTVKDIDSRAHAEEVAGAVLGVTRISNHLQAADAPSGADDAGLLKAVLAYLGDFHAFDYGGDITVKVQQKVVTLRGKAGLYMGRQKAALVASQVKGVEGVDNRIKVDPSVAPRKIQVRAEK